VIENKAIGQKPLKGLALYKSILKVYADYHAFYTALAQKNPNGLVSALGTFYGDCIFYYIAPV
jgi:hypothetical protein